MAMANIDIRGEARAAYVPLWRICKELKISEPTMTRKLRNELSSEEKTQIRSIIKRLKVSDSREEEL